MPVKHPRHCLPYLPQLTASEQAAVSAGAELCGDFFAADSISATVGRLVDGDGTAAIFDRNVGELMVRVV